MVGFLGVVAALCASSALAMPHHDRNTMSMHSNQPFLTREQIHSLPREQLENMVNALLGRQETQSSTKSTPNSLSVEDDDEKISATATSGWPPIWPRPTAFENGTSSITVSANLTFNFKSSSQDVLDAADRYKQLMFSHRLAQEDNDGAMLTAISVTIDDPNAQVQVGVDEQYTLTIVGDGTASIHSSTQIGFYWALETLSQLIWFDFDSNQYTISAVPWSISDSPRFAHREILVDSSRHFLPVPTLKIIIDSMTYAKLNVLHWHIVDSQSFPLTVPSYPKLNQMGAYSAQERYSVNDVEDIVEYARKRGIRVIPEIDNPGHASSWCSGYPNVCPSLDCREPLNPATEDTFTLLGGVLKDVSGMFADQMIHLGGDEVNTACWTKSASISQWLTAHNYTADDAYYYFVGRAHQIALGLGRQVIGWEEIWNHFGTKLDKRTIIQQWLPGSTVAKECVAAGYRVLWSTDGVWYLDGLSVTWETMYQQEPCTGISDSDCSQYVLGGGGEQWGETADTSDVLQTIWPRAAAIAERLWSPRDVTSTTDAAPRLASFRCHLNLRAVAAAPSNNSVARTAPPGPGGCYLQ